MRILFVSQLFDPEYSIKGLELMKYWVSLGYEVEVLTTFPNYPQGKVFDGYKLKFKSIEVIEGVKVTRLWSHISHSKSKLSRAFSYLSFTFMALYAALFSKKPDVVYTYHPQSTTGIIGILMHKLRGVPFITDVQDLWPDSLYATGVKQKGMLVKLIDKWCKLTYSCASQVVVLSEGFKNVLIERGVVPEKINVVYNWCPEEAKIGKVLAKNKGINNLYSKDKPAVFVYAGNMGSAQSLKTIIDAVSNFDNSQIILKLVGGGVEKDNLKNYISYKKIKNVIISDYIPAAGIVDALNKADVLVVHLKDEPLFKITIPSKTQFSLAMGKPLLMAVGGEANGLVAEGRAGIVAEPENVESITLAIDELLQHRDKWDVLGVNARILYLDKLSAEVNYTKLNQVLSKAVSQNGS